MIGERALSCVVSASSNAAAQSCTLKYTARPWNVPYVPVACLHQGGLSRCVLHSCCRGIRLQHVVIVIVRVHCHECTLHAATRDHCIRRRWFFISLIRGFDMLLGSVDARSIRGLTAGNHLAPSSHTQRHRIMCTIHSAFYTCCTNKLPMYIESERTQYVRHWR